MSMLQEGAMSFAQGGVESRVEAIRAARAQRGELASRAGRPGESEAAMHPRGDVDTPSSRPGGPHVDVHGQAGLDGPQVFRPLEQDGRGFVSPGGDRVLLPNTRPDPDVFGPTRPLGAGDGAGRGFHPRPEDGHFQAPGYHPTDDHPVAPLHAFGELDRLPGTPRREPSDFDLHPTRPGSDTSSTVEPAGSRAAQFREGTAAAMLGTEMQLRPAANPHATPKALRA